MNSARSSLSKGGRSEQRDGGKSARPDVAWFKPRHTGSAPIKSMDGPGFTPSPSPLSPPRPLAPCGEEASKDVFAIRGLPIDFVPFMQRLGATRPAAIRVTPFGDCLLPAFGGKRGKESAAEERFGEETARRKGTRMKADSALDRLRRCSDRLGERRDGEGGKERISRARRAAVRNSLSLSRLCSDVGVYCRKQRFPGASTRHEASIRGSQLSPTKIGQRARIGATSATILSSHRERIASRRRLINSLVITRLFRSCFAAVAAGGCADA